ncbi:hypothetical protein B8W66_20875 [Mycobacterium decipiens]|uniref:PPE family protein n=1 Tax=Mycobacterium decipiens TaxID=1430326 RepID=A0A1X2LPV1_9MYCO|nr:hypothetical protein B8W66_20875 [Mycobacterium decipiens]
MDRAARCADLNFTIPANLWQFNVGGGNIGGYNVGSANIGFGNTGDNNFSFFWRGDYQGLAAFRYDSAVSEFLWSYDIRSDIEIPITGTINAITQDAFTIAEFQIPISLQVTVCLTYIPIIGCVLHVSITVPITTEHLGPYEIDASVINPDTPIDTVFRQSFNFPGSGTLGPFPFGFGWQQSPGFFNSTTTPSSGFFNDAAGNASGSFNAGGIGNSGLQNFGTQLSGWANPGNTLSGFYNTSVLNVMTQAVISGFANYGAQLSGLLSDGTGP